MIKPLLKLVDENRIALTPAVAPSFLYPSEQQEVYAFYENDEITPSYAQAVKMKKRSADGKLNYEKISEIMSETKGNQKEFLKIPEEGLSRYLSPSLSEKQKQDFVLKACEHYHKYLIKQRNRGAR